MFELLIIQDEVLLLPGELENFNHTLEQKIIAKYIDKV